MCLILGKRSAEADLWVLEDDEIFVGDASEFFHSFARLVRADYVSTFQPHPLADCIYKEATTRALLIRNTRPCVPPARSPRDSHAGDSRSLWPVHKWEHIERFSPRLLFALDKLLTRGAATHGEVFASSVCSVAAWCSSLDLRESGSVDAQGKWRGDSKKGVSSLLLEGLWHHVFVQMVPRFEVGESLSIATSALRIEKGQLDSATAWVVRGFRALGLTTGKEVSRDAAAAQAADNEIPSKLGPAPRPSRAARIRLFCWTVAHPNDVARLRMAYGMRAGLFACDEWILVTNATVRLPFRRVARAIRGSMDSPRGGTWNSAMNTRVFSVLSVTNQG